MGMVLGGTKMHLELREIGQQIGYSGLGTERDLRCRNVYMLDYIRE